MIMKGSPMKQQAAIARHNALNHAKVAGMAAAALGALFFAMAEPAKSAELPANNNAPVAK